MFDIAQCGGEQLKAERLETIRQLIREHPQAHRRRLSQLLCQAWNWKNEQGCYKDMAARRLMLKLHRRGDITLPERRRLPTNAQRGRTAKLVPAPLPEVEGPLSALQPLRLELIAPGHADRGLLEGLLAQYHYLSYRGTVGENVQYLVHSCGGQPLACLVFEAAAWKVAARDRWLGWSAEMRQTHLRRITNNSRFLILPSVRVAHLASHVLSLATRRLRADWQAKYGHTVELVETFVERERFEGCCYRAANWLRLGQTEGRSRNDSRHERRAPLKDVYVYPLHRHFRRALGIANG